MLLLSCCHRLSVRLLSRLSLLSEIRFHLNDVSAVSLNHPLILVSQLIFRSLLQVEKIGVLLLSSSFGLAEQLLKLSLLLGHRLKSGIALFLLVAGQICQVLNVLICHKRHFLSVVLDQAVGRLRVVVVTSSSLLGSRSQDALVIPVRRFEVVVEATALDIECCVRVVQGSGVGCGLLLSLTDKSADTVLLKLELRSCFGFLLL